MSQAKANIAKLEGARWEILRVLAVGGHVGATESMIYHTIVAMWPDIHRGWVKDQMSYLESRKLIALERHEIKDWRAQLTRNGWDVHDYVVDCEAGIARPRKYWGNEAP